MMYPPKFGYKNVSEMLRMNDIHQELIDRALQTYDRWTRYLLKHENCPQSVTIKYATSNIWYQRIAAVFPKNKYKKFNHYLLNESDKRVLKYLERVSLWEGGYGI